MQSRSPGSGPCQTHLQAAEGLVFVYPTWWYGLPAMLKGWLDRVWTPDITFRSSPDTRPDRPLMTHIRCSA
jgi:NAD(P)H dehydrogenase (quinone)